MVRKWIEYKGQPYPIIGIEGYKVDRECTDKDEIYIIADDDLQDAIDEDVMTNDDKANFIDIWVNYYCSDDLVLRNPTEEQVIEYFREQGMVD